MTADANGFRVILEIRDRGVTRSFEGWEESRFGRAIQEIWADEDRYADLIARAFYEIHGTSEEAVKEACKALWEKKAAAFHEEALPWYLTEFFRTIHVDDATDRWTRKLFEEYRITIKACREHYFYLLEGRPPGPEDRSDDEGWELIHPPFFQETKPPVDRKDPAKVRGLADTILLLAPHLVECADAAGATRLMSWFRIRLRCKVQSDPGRADVVVALAPKVDLDVKTISLPPHHGRTLVSSENVRTAVARLAHVWNNQTASSVLLSASPGSGKEILFELLSAASRAGKTDRIEVSAPTIDDFDTLVQLLAGNATEDKRGSGELYPAERILFLDEIHHEDAAAVRTGLLRMMETDVARTRDGRVIRCDRLLYVLATSLSPDRLLEVEPPDLWTRIEHNVVLKHPLFVGEKERREVLLDYFAFFWGRQLDSWRAGEDDEPMTGDEFFRKRQREMAKELTEGLDDPSSLAEVFVERMESPMVPVVSIRIIRSFVKRLFEKTVAHRREQERGVSSIADDQRLQEGFGKWVDEVFVELVPRTKSGELF